MAIILDGKKLSEKILEGLKKKIKKSGKKLKLVAVLVGDDKNSKVFLRQKEKACNFVGIDFELYQFPENISQKALEEKVKKIGSQKNHGVMVQLPLPKYIDTQEILNLIPLKKDVERVFSPVLAGILELFKKYKIEFKGKNVVVVGRGRLVGRPVADWMGKNWAKVFVVDEKTSDISQTTKKADILISGAGRPNLIKGNMVKKGVVAVDAAGDVDFKSVEPKASYITPIPGGLGPMTVAMLLKNLFLLNSRKYIG